MARHIDDEVAYYYDFYPTREDQMGETVFHADLVRYLFDVLSWHLRNQICAIYENLNFYQTSNPDEYPLAPDLAVIMGVPVHKVRSLRIGKTTSAPHIVFEIGSDETWKKDLEEKPIRYAQMGVEEYFAYDPNEPPLLRRVPRRLYGWQLDKERRAMREMPLGPGGRLWSSHLACFLVPDDQYLRLYDRHGQLCLTKEEAETRRAEAEASRAESEASRAEAEASRAEAEAEARRAETRRAEAEASRAEAEAEARRAETKRAEALASKLRALGIDPDQI